MHSALIELHKRFTKANCFFILLCFRNPLKFVSSENDYFLVFIFLSFQYNNALVDLNCAVRIGIYCNLVLTRRGQNLHVSYILSKSFNNF